MYTLVSAVTLQALTGAQYATTDLSQTPVNVMFSIYSEIYLTLSNPYLSANVYVDLLQYKPQIDGFSGTLAQWFTNIGNMTLTTISAVPSTTVTYARYSDATYSGYKANVCQIGFQIPLNYPTDTLPDLQVTRPGYSTDLSLINNYCIATVNGYLHRTDYDGTYAYIQQGAVTMRKSNLNNFGFLSFLDIGQIQVLPIDVTKVYADTSVPGMSLKNKIYMNINQDTTGKSVLLSLGGYLVMPTPGIFYQVGTGIYCLHTDALPLLQRYFESVQYIDLSSLGLSSSIMYPQTINAPEFLSDTVLLKYLQLSQSFWIVVDSPNVSFSQTLLESGKIPGLYVSYEQPINPLIVGYGRMAEYWTVYEDQKWSMHVDNSFLMNFGFATNPDTVSGNINPALIPGNEISNSQGYSLLIHS